MKSNECYINFENLQNKIIMTFHMTAVNTPFTYKSF